MIITRTPYRLSLFGGGTDYNSWFEDEGGLIIAAAISYYCRLSVRFLPQFFPEYKSRIVYSSIEVVKNNSEIKHPSVRSCLKFMNMLDGVEIHHDGDLPARSGIGSSSSFTVGLLNALYALKEKMMTADDLAKQAIHVEQSLIGESVGIQDQIIAAHGGIRIMELGLGNNWTTSPLILSKDYLLEFEKHILLGFSGVSRMAEKHAKVHVDNIKAGKTNHQLREISALAHEALHAFKKESSLEKIGKLLNLGWQIKRKLAENITADWMDDLYSTAISEGAFGGKLMGAGGGGFFFFIAPPEKHKQIKSKLSSIKCWVPFKIDKSGSQVIVYSGE